MLYSGGFVYPNRTQEPSLTDLMQISELVLTEELQLDRAGDLFGWLRSQGCKAAGTGNAFEGQSAPWFTALHRAIIELPGDTAPSNQRNQLIKLLVTKAYADVNAPDSTGVTPLQCAAQQHNHDAAAILLQFCADPNNTGGIKQAMTARGLHHSPSSKPAPTVPIKTKIPSSPRRTVKVVGTRKDEPQVAARHTVAGIVQEQAKTTASQNQLVGAGDSPLRIAAVSDDVKMVKLLLEYKATPEVQDEWGNISPSVFKVIREFGGNVGKHEIHVVPSEAKATTTELSPFLDKIRQMSEDRLLLETGPASPSKPLGNLSPQAAARAYTRQMELLVHAEQIKAENLALEQASAATSVRKSEEKHVSNKAMSEVEEMLARRHRASGTSAIRKSLDDHDVKQAAKEEEEATARILAEAEAQVKKEREAHKQESWADQQIDDMLSRRNRVRSYN